MAGQKVRVDDIAEAITEIVREYCGDLAEDVDVAIDVTAKECAADISAHSPRRKKSRGYWKGWKVVKDNGHSRHKRIVWNPKFYRIVHLLEKGHVKRGGGRVEGKPHVGPAEKKYSLLLEKRIIDVVERSGK